MLKDKYYKYFEPNKIIFFLSLFLCFSIALPHTILPGKAGSISILLFILWIIDGNLKLKIKILSTSKLFLSILSLILLLTLSLLWTKYSNHGLMRLSAFKYYLFLIPILITSLTKEKSLKLIHAFVLGTILHAFLMILHSYNLIHLPSKLTLYSPYAVYASFFVFSSFYCFFYFSKNISNKNITRSLIYFLCMLIFIYIIFTSKGRAAQITFILCSILSLSIFHKNWTKTTLSLVIITALITVTILSSKTVKTSYTHAASDIEHALENNYHSSWGARWGLLVANYEIFKHNPILGVGVGDTKDEMQRVIERGRNQALYPLSYYDQSHNQYINILVSTGIIGLILYILTHVFLFKLSIKHTEIKYLSLIFLTSLIVNGIADNILFYKPYNIYVALMIALFINLSLDKNDKEAPIQSCIK